MSASPKEKRSTAVAGLTPLLDASNRPIYAVDASRRIVYCNLALATWLGIERSQIVGRYVEYHSVPTANGESASRDTAGVLTELCPPPVALAGMQCAGTVATVARDGRLIHRRADFLPLAGAEPTNATSDGANGTTAVPKGVLVLLAPVDMSAQELSAEVSEEATPGELHRAIRRFRHTQVEKFAIESLLGSSSVIGKVRTQVAAAAAGRANVLVRGRRGSGRAHVARAIHYHASQPTDRLLPLDCGAASEDIMRRTMDSARGAGRGDQRTTLLLLDLEQLLPALQLPLLAAIKDTSFAARFIATIAIPPDQPSGGPTVSTDLNAQLDARLLDAVSTITIDVPRLADRLEDLPLLAQSFVEACNCGSMKQIGSIRPDALDLLALYRWPGELNELRNVIAAAHAACAGQLIIPADLPAVVHHAAKAAALPRRAPPEPIVLDEVLASIEREVIGRALAQADGNKTAAAELLGMTRPRLYRRLAQLGLISDTAIEFHEDPSP